MRPVRARFWLTIAVVVAVPGGPRGRARADRLRHRPRPARPARRRQPCRWCCTGAAYLAAAVAAAGLIAWYVTSTARLSQAILLDLRKRVFLHTQRLSLEFHEKYTSGRIIARQTSDLDAIRELLDSGLSSLARVAVHGVHRDRAVRPGLAQRALLVLAAGVPLYVPDPLVPDALADRLPRIPRGLGAADRAVRRDDDRHPRGQGVPQGTRATRRASAGSSEDYRDVDRPLHPPLRRLRARAGADRQRAASPSCCSRRLPGRSAATSRSACCWP